MSRHPRWRIVTNILASLSVLGMFYHSDKLVSTNVIFSTFLNIFYNACLGYIVQYTFVRRSTFNVLHYIPAFPLLLVLVALPSVVKANVDELDINGTMASLTGATAAAVAGGAMSSAMDSVEKFTMKDMKWSPEDIAGWSPTHKNSIIHIIVIRMSPGTTTYNDGLGQIIACVLLVWLLNLWGKVSKEKHEIFPQIISLDGPRDKPKKCKGYTDLFTIIRHHPALSGHHVKTIARTGLRYTKEPENLELMIKIAKEVVDYRNADTSKAILSFELKAMDSYFIKSIENKDRTITSGIVRWRELENNCVNNTQEGEGTKKDVALDYSDVVHPEDKKKQDRTNILASEKINDLIYSTAVGDGIRQLIKDGVADGRGIPDVGMLSMLNDAMPELKEGGHKQEKAVAGIIKSVCEKAQTMNIELPPNLARAEAVSFTRRSVGIPSKSIGDSANVVMGGAGTLPRHQAMVNLSALDVVHDVQNDVAFIHAESVSRDMISFHEGHANLLVLLILSDMDPFVVASTLVRFGADIVIITTILEFICQLETKLVIADCIGYDVQELAKNEARRKLEIAIERSKLVEAKEDIISKLDEEEQRRHRVMTTVGNIRSLYYDDAKDLQDEDIERKCKDMRSATRRAALKDDSYTGSLEGTGNQKMPAKGAAADEDSDSGFSITKMDRKMPAKVSTVKRKRTIDDNVDVYLAKKKKSGKKRANSKGGDDSMVEDSEEEAPPTKKKARTTAAAKKKTKSKKYDDDSDDMDFESEEEPPPKKRTKKAPAKKKASSHRDDSDIEFMGQSQATSAKPSRSRTVRATTKKPKYNYDDSDVEEINDSEEGETPAPKARGKKKVPPTKVRAPSQTQSTMTSAASSFTSARKPAASGQGRRNVQYLDSDSDDDEPSSSFGTGGAWGTASQSTKGRSRR